MFDALFKLAEVEKVAYLKASKTTKARAANKLSTCATVLHLAVQTGVTVIRVKTVKALVGHVLQTVPGSGDHYCKPLATHYIKTLHSVLEYQPHTEHLKSEDWQILVHFCNDGIQALSESLDETDSSDLVILDGSEKRRCQPSRSATPSSVTGSITSVRKPTARNPSDGIDKQTTDVLIQCLSELFKVPHAPIFKVARTTLDTLLDFLSFTSPLSHTQSQEAAFSCINIILCATITEDLSLATLIVERTVSHIRRLWQSRTHPCLKKEMILVVINGEPLFSKSLDTDEDFRNELERLLDVLQGEYTKRVERELLQSDDLLFHNTGPKSAGNPLSNCAFRLRLGTQSSELSWATLWSIAMVFTHVHDHTSMSSPSSRKNRFETPKKRRKISSPLNTIIDTISTSMGSEKVAILQIASFITLETSFEVNALGRLVEVLTPFISNEASSLASWAMLTLSW